MADIAEQPFRTLTYELGQRDALAGAALGRVPTGWEKIRMMGIIAVAGLLAGMVPADWPSALYWITVVALLVAGAAGALLASNLAFRREVSTLPIPHGTVRLDAFADRIAEHSALGTRTVPLDSISMVVATNDHLLIREGKLPVIVPARAFASRTDMDGFARWIEAAESPGAPN